MNKRTPDLTRIALEFVTVTVNSIDAKRSFRVYKKVMTSRCHNLSNRNTAMLVELYDNSSYGLDPVCSNSDSEESET